MNSTDMRVPTARNCAGTGPDVDLSGCADRIVTRVDNWLEKYGALVPSVVRRRRQAARSWRHFVLALLGLATPMSLPSSRRVVIFQGVRNKRYHALFEPGEVLIVGARAERDYARANGHAFAWSFPIEGAIRTALGRGNAFFLKRQLRNWIALLRAHPNVGIFLYEDSQPLGAYLANVAAVAGEHVKVICIQHGYFSRPVDEWSFDGAISGINFVWDKAQAELIGCPPQSTFVIGPPVTAIAQATTTPNVILVGTGTNNDGTSDYERTVDWYKSLVDALPESLRTRVWYRPHPNELQQAGLLDRLEDLFRRVDRLPLTERLGGDVAIFVGSVSSVLFEARFAGHRVIHASLREDFIPVFERDAEFSGDQAEEAAEWIARVCGSGEIFVATPAPRPEVDFASAVETVLPGS